MFENSKFALAAHAGICIIIAFMGAFEQNILKRIILSIAVLFLYFVTGSSFANQGTRLKNFISVVGISCLSLLFALVCCTIYQFEVINTYHYSVETSHYIISRFICFAYNASVAPIAGLAGDYIPALKLPFGLLFTFFVPSLMMWMGLQWKTKRDAKEQSENVFIKQIPHANKV